jgi:hypothetical protein
VRVALLGSLLVLRAASLAGQTDSTQAAFVQAVRDASRRYQDQAAAIADGYRRVGPDFPSMGEHWISVPLIVTGAIDPLRPPILEYITASGRPVLVGVAYTQLVGAGSPAALLPAPAEAWHYHSGTVDEESFVLGHAASASAHNRAGPRIAVLHAWVWFANPAGLFATDNWALPYLRVGLPPPPTGSGPSPPALAVALAAGGGAYFEVLLRLRHALPAGTAAQVAEILREHATRLRGRLEAASAAGLPPDDAGLARAWDLVEADIRGACPVCSLRPGH